MLDARTTLGNKLITGESISVFPSKICGIREKYVDKQNIKVKIINTRRRVCSGNYCF